MPIRRLLLATIVTGTAATQMPAYELDELPKPVEGFEVEFFAKEPDLMHSGALCFDAKGRLFVGGGPQFRRPQKDTPPDSIVIVTDTDGDGKGDKFKQFATNLNCIQAMAWKGNDLWVANCPDVTVLRDLDGDDVADEYIRVFTGLGHLRHGLHGFNWAPDGRLYMSQGNSAVQSHAPKAFRDLMHIKSDAPDVQEVETFKASEYKPTYLDGWPSKEGGFLRCGEMGKDLEIFARGNRNPWDMAFDDEFTWMATDNDDGPEHDRFIVPFYGAHFGKMHAWSYSWSGEGNPATVPCAALFPRANGSGVGVVFYRSEQFPEEYRNAFLIGDWTDKSVYVFRREWDGAWLKPKGVLEELVNSDGTKSLFRPTDIEVGPDGALYVAGWGAQYGSRWAPYQGGDKNAKDNEGRVFKIWYGGNPLISKDVWFPAKRSRAYSDWSVDELIEDLNHQVPVWSVNAQDELVRRGKGVAGDLWKALDSGELSTGQETWTVWALGRIGESAEKFSAVVADADAPENRRRQAIAVLAFLGEGETALVSALGDGSARVRHAAATALLEMGKSSEAVAAGIEKAVKSEKDRIVFYTLFRALAELGEPDLESEDANLRRASLLALAEKGGGKESIESVRPLTVDVDPDVAAVAALWMKKVAKESTPALAIEPAGSLFFDPMDVNITASVKGADIRYTLDGSDPGKDSEKFQQPIRLEKTTMVRAALFREGERISAIMPAQFRKLTEKEWKERLIVSDLKTKGGKAYKVLDSPIATGALIFEDRDYTVKQIPPVMEGARQILTSNNDSGAGKDADETFLTFRISQPATVFVAYDARQNSAPKWLQEFESTGELVKTSDTDFRVFKKNFPGGEVKLGGNGAAASMYLVALRKPSALRTTLEASLALMKKADAGRGHEIFFTKGGCIACHRMEDKGNDVGPDLADIGLRTDAGYIAQSILEPNAVVIEGFILTTIQTKDGKTYFGMVRDETARELTLVQLDGSPVVIEQQEIKEKGALDQSAMPPIYPDLLSPQEVADMTAWLMQQKKKHPDLEKKD